MKRIQQLSAVALAIVALVQEVAASDAQLPPVTRQVQLVRQPDGHYARRLVEVPVPTPGDREVLVHIRAVSIQRTDIEILPDLPGAASTPDLTGLIAGSDGAGDVVRVGRLVTSVRPGQKVISFPVPNYIDRPTTVAATADFLGRSVNGVFGDYVVLKETAVVPMPQHLSYEEAASLPSSGVTAWNAVDMERNLIQKSDTVLIEGTGAVSMLALQLAVARGARVIVTSSSDEKLKQAKALGAAIGINYKKVPNWSAEVLNQTEGRGVDLVIDIGGRSTLEHSINSLANEGTVALTGGLGGYDGSISALSLMNKAARARGVFGGSRTDMLHLCQFIEQHRIHPVVGRTYPLSDLETAYDDLASGNFIGKLVLKF